MNALLYFIVVMIWGTTWFAITLQQGDVPVLVSVFWRFAIASGVMLFITRFFLRHQRLAKQDHFFCLLQGVCAFSINFVCFYLATGYLNSGIESVIFSMAVLFNTVNQAIFYGIRPNRRFWPAAGLGVAGITLLFAEQLFAQSFSWQLLGGLVLSLVGTYGFSLGNMLSIRHQQRGLSVLTTNSWAMFYGACIAGMLAWLLGDSLSLSWQPIYLSALIYLALFGSIIGFGAYYCLVGKIGAGKAAYATVLFPLVALTISTFYEGYQWQLHNIVGLILIILGNVVMFFPKKRMECKTNPPCNAVE